MHNIILGKASQIDEAQREENEEKRVLDIAEKLMSYKYEAANLYYLARILRDQEGRLAVCQQSVSVGQLEGVTVILGIKSQKIL